MQSQRKNPGSYFSRQQVPIQNSKSNAAYIKKLSVETQTEHIPNFEKQIRLCNFSSMSMKEIQENYVGSLRFLNRCHDYFNHIFMDNVTDGDSNLEGAFDFRVPEVPNYFKVMEMFLEKSIAQNNDQNRNKIENMKKVNKEISENNAKEKELDDSERIIFDLQQFLPKNIGDGPGAVQNSRGIMFQDGEHQRTEGVKSFTAKKRPSTSPSRLVKSEKDIPKRPISRHELKTLSNTFEERLNSCNEFERKSNEYFLQNDAPMEFYQSPLEEGGNMIILEQLHQQDDQGNSSTPGKKQETSFEDNFKTSRNEGKVKGGDRTYNKSKKNLRDNLNWIDYALINFKQSEYDSSDSPSWSSPRGTTTSENVNMIPSQDLLTQNLQGVFYKYKDVSLLNKKSLSVLNEVRQSKSPKKVNDMFEKLSKEDLRGNKTEKAKGSWCHFDDTAETIIGIIDEAGFCDDLRREYSRKGFLEERQENDEASSSDSVILTDEEFERKNRNDCVIWSKEMICLKKEQRNKNETNVKDVALAQDLTRKPLKSHPLKLTDKDKSLADQRMLKKIGLFTEKGDFRPGVVSILEEKQRTNFLRDSAKNVQFRSQRKVDVKLQYNMKNHINQPACMSLTAASWADQESRSNESLHSSVTYSSSTVSDSDLLSIEPNSSEINKFQ